LLIFGILLTLTLVFRARTAAKGGDTAHRATRVYAPYIVIVLGALLATSLYSLLQTGFASSVKQRFDAAALNHVEAIEHGIEAYLETLYHIRSAFYASSFVDRDEFRTLVSRSLASNPGIKALEWVPRVAAQARDAMEAAAREEVSPEYVFVDHPDKHEATVVPPRDVYFPIYYVEPQETFLSVLGFDLATRPDHLAALMKAAQDNTPVVSSRLQLSQSEKGTYSVFVALPIYNKDVPQTTSEEREAALRGFAVMVVEIGPMIEAILDKSTNPAGLSLTYADVEADDEKVFMYRHISRELDLGPGNSETDYLDDGLTSTTTLAFADQNWQVTAHAASREIYPDWDSGNFWLPLGILLLSFGLAFFLYRLKLAESELSESRESFELAMKAGELGMWDWRLKSGELFVNDGWAEMIGHSKDEISNSIDEWSSRLHPDDTDATMAAFNDYVEGRTVYYQPEFRFRAKDGIYRWILSIGKAIERDEQGNPLRMIGIHMDITERKRMVYELAKSKEAADAANQAKSAFLANMSHELRTPMNAILGYSEMLTEEAEDLGQEAFIPDLKKINQAGTHLLALINDVLDLSKIESGKMEAFAEEINLDRLIDEVTATAQPLMGKNNNHLSIERGKDLGNVHQDLTKLRQMLFNLLSNAAKFTHEGTVTLHVNRSEQAGEDWLTFAISDTGIGIAEDKLEHVFEEFDSGWRSRGVSANCWVEILSFVVSWARGQPLPSTFPPSCPGQNLNTRLLRQHRH
jgi:PAS domain S-box-containing protein